MIIQIPFAGFYNSLHDSEIDRAFEDLIQDDSGEPIEELQDDLYQHVNALPHLPYAKDYAEAFNDYVAHEHDADLGLTWESMASPKEYNFSTDRIFCEITEEKAAMLRTETPDNVLQEIIRDNFTSCSGFISSYSNDLEDWPEKIEAWDHNQLYTLLIAGLTSEGENIQDIDFTVYDFGNLSEAAMQAVDETLTPELIALTDKAYEMRTKGEG